MVTGGTDERPEPQESQRRALRLQLLHEASQRLVRTVDGLADERLQEDSLLPGWSRAHVVAHLALNAEALERVLNRVAAREPVTMYGSQEERDGDIAELAATGPSAVRERLLKSVTCFGEALRTFPADRVELRVERVPGGPDFRAGDVPAMRWREVEVHHADLDAGYTREQWPAAFSVDTLDALATGEAPPRTWPRPVRLLARDVARTWDVGTGEPELTVTGNAADLAWWLTGRGGGDGLTSDQGELPEVPAW